MAPRSHVVLLKSPRSTLSPSTDPYIVSLSSSSPSNDPIYTPHLLPVLSTSLHLTHLTDLISSGPSLSNIQAIILTSARSVEAWSSSASSLPSGADWTNTTFYVVGPSTSRSLLSIPSEWARPMPERVVGQETGCAEKLAELIISRLRPANSDGNGERGKGKLVHLTGDKTLGTLPRMLRAALPDVELEEVKVYSTERDSEFEQNLSALLDSVAPQKVEWVVVFSPSGAEMAFPDLVERGVLRPAGKGEGEGGARIMAIGPTTEAWLVSKGWKVAATADKPGPEEVRRALRRADGLDEGGG